VANRGLDLDVGLPIDLAMVHVDSARREERKDREGGKN
jgi:hypothetical protein